MLSFAVAVVAIALADRINPSVIAAELFLAAGSHPGRRTIASTFAAWTVTFLTGLALALGRHDLILSLRPSLAPPSRTRYSLRPESCSSSGHRGLDVS